MIPGTALIGLTPGVIPTALSAMLGNALIVLSILIGTTFYFELPAECVPQRTSLPIPRLDPCE